MEKATDPERKAQHFGLYLVWLKAKPLASKRNCIEFLVPFQNVPRYPEVMKRAHVNEFWSSLTAEQIDAVQAVAMDMWDPYVNSTHNHLPEAQSKIVFDKFHIAKHLSEAVDQVRRREHKQLKARGDDRLAGTRYDWLRHPGKMDPADRKEFAALRDSNLKTAKAWALKEGMMAFFEYIYERPARRHYKGWRSGGHAVPVETHR